MRIVFLFPHPAVGVTGGYKVALERAGELARRGHFVTAVYSGSIFWRKKSLFHKLTAVVRYVQWRWRKRYSSRRWMALEPSVKERLSLSLCQRHVPKADVYVATSPYTAWYLSRYKVDVGVKRLYFIQDKEDWGAGLKSILEQTYHAPLRKIVIARWLKDMLRDEYGEDSVMVPNGFDMQEYHVTREPEAREAATVSMLWHNMDRKDCPTGLAALKMVKEKRPKLKVYMFGVPERPDFLPEWVEYYRQPSMEEHLRINNTAAIYLGTSKVEGWGLTVGEAMACGQAVVCTDNKGYLEMAEDGRNALVVPVGDASAMAEAIIRLIDDDQLRIKLARQGYEDIQRFDIRHSVDRFADLIERS